MRFDMHLPTRRYSSCSAIALFEFLDRACAAGLDGVVIAEHDYLWPVDVRAERRAFAPHLIVIAGMKVGGLGGGVLVYGVTDPSAVPRGIEWPDLTHEARRQGGARDGPPVPLGSAGGPSARGEAARDRRVGADVIEYG